MSGIGWLARSPGRGNRLAGWFVNDKRSQTEVKARTWEPGGTTDAVAAPPAPVPQYALRSFTTSKAVLMMIQRSKPSDQLRR